jgi:hypothetical protein
MFSDARSYPTVSQVCMLAPETAAAALDVMILDPAVTAHLLPTGALQRARPTGYQALRRLPAALLLPGRRGRIAVTLELLPWSQQRCELSIWTTDRPTLLRAGSTKAYLEAAHRSLTTLQDLMDARHLPGHGDNTGSRGSTREPRRPVRAHTAARTGTAVPPTGGTARAEFTPRAARDFAARAGSRTGG